MAFWSRSKPYSVDKPIVAFSSNVDTPFSVTLNALDFGLNYTDFPDEPSKKSYPGGHFIVRETATTATSATTYYRFLPAAAIAAEVLAADEVNSTTTSPGSITITVTRAYPFTLSRDNGKNFSLVKYINGGIGEVYTYHNALSLTAIDHKTRKLTFNKNYEANNLRNWIGNPSSTPYDPVYLIRSDYRRYISRIPPSATPTPVELQTELVTQNILGIHEHALDFTDVPTLDIAVVSRAAGIYAKNLPYRDPEILYAFQSTLNPRDSF